MVKRKPRATLEMDEAWATLNLQCRRFDTFDLDPSWRETSQRRRPRIPVPLSLLPYYRLADSKCGCQEHLMDCAHGDLGKRDRVAMHTFGRAGNHIALININFGAELP